MENRIRQVTSWKRRGLSLYRDRYNRKREKDENANVIDREEDDEEGIIEDEDTGEWYFTSYNTGIIDNTNKSGENVTDNAGNDAGRDHGEDTFESATFPVNSEKLPPRTNRKDYAAMSKGTISQVNDDQYIVFDNQYNKIDAMYKNMPDKQRSEVNNKFIHCTEPKKVQITKHEWEYYIPPEFPSHIKFHGKMEPLWNIAIELENLGQYVTHEAFEIVNFADIPKNAHITSTRMLLTKKGSGTKEDPAKLKARLTIRGDIRKRAMQKCQEENPVINSYAGGSSVQAVSAFLAVTVERGNRLAKADMSQAYLNVELGEDTEHYFFKIRTGVNDEVIYCKANRAIYGDVLSARLFSKWCEARLKKRGFQKCPVDPTLWTKEYKDGKIAMIARHSDDFLISGDEVSSERAISEVSQGVKCTVERNPTSFLGITINYDVKRGVMKLNQTDKIVSAVRAYECDAKAAYGPFPSKTEVDTIAKEGGIDLEYVTPYKSLFATISQIVIRTRSDVTYHIKELSRYMEKPNKQLYSLLKQVLQFMYQTKDKEIVYSRDEMLKHENISSVVIYVDTGFRDVLRDVKNDKPCRKTTFGYIIKYKGCTIRVKCGTTTVTCNSTLEAEYIGTGEAARSGVFTTKLLNFLGVFNFTPRILCDNKGAVAVANDAQALGRTKHLDIKHHVVRDFVENKQVQVVHVDTENNMADILTKNLSRKLFMKHQKNMFNPYIGKEMLVPAMEDVDFIQPVVDEPVYNWDDVVMYPRDQIKGNLVNDCDLFAHSSGVSVGA